MKELMRKYWLFLLIILQPVLDMIAYFQYDSKIGTMAGYIRLVFMVVVVFYALYKTPKKKSYLLLISIIAIYCLLHIANGFRVGYVSLVQDVSYMAKVVHMPVMGIAFCYLLEDDSDKGQIIRGFVYNFVVIVTTTILAYITGTGDFTYKAEKVGMMGWFANANAQSIILVTLVPFVLYWVLRKKKTIFSILTMVFVNVVLLANGTKAAYLSVFLIFGGLIVFYLVDYFITKEKEYRKKKRPYLVICFVLMVLMVGSVLVYPMTPRYVVDMTATGAREDENEKIEKKKEEIVGGRTLEEIVADPQLRAELVSFYESDLSPILVEKFGAERVLEAYGWMPDSYTIADVRLQKRMCAQLMWEDQDLLTKITGMEFTHMQEFDLENDYAAILYYYGYLGMGLYVIFLAYFVVIVLCALVKRWKYAFNDFNFMLFLVYILQLGLAQFSGAILRRPNASIYLALVVALIFYQCRTIREKDFVIRGSKCE